MNKADKEKKTKFNIFNIKEAFGNFAKKIPRKLWLFGLAAAICLLLCGCLMLTEAAMKKSLTDQQMASRWSDKKDTAQISCFFAEGEVESADYFREVAQNLDKALVEASIEAPMETARLWIDAISHSGKLVVTSSQATVELEAVGVQGDFFQFHPLQLKYGSFFSDDSMMNDGIVIDEETAWKLFGSSDVAGMQVMIGNVPHFVVGVVERQSGRLEEAAGLDSSVCYVFLNSLEKYGSLTGGFTYEIVMPNPIKGFALGAVNSAVNAENTEVAVVENQTRFEILPLLNVAKSFGIRSMSQRGIVYPYWENIARGYEDILAVTLIMKLLLLIVSVVWVFITLIYLWKHKTWNTESLRRWSGDKIYDMQAKRVVKKHRKKKDATVQVTRKKTEDKEETEILILNDIDDEVKEETVQGGGEL